MALIMNNNIMATNASRNLGVAYNRLTTSTQRLSSGLRINSAADDAAGLAIRELMRADIAATRQGLRNAADAISLIQTADGALGVIDEKLIRMKELAEQAATGTYTTVQRSIINSEYQAMAKEIDRIANATNFNGIKLLDGSINQQHGGQGLKVHFGTGNNAAEDYYFLNIGDARATSSSGLRVGGDAKNDIWATGMAAGQLGADGGCCASGYESLTRTDLLASGAVFSYGYNWDGKGVDGQLLDGKHLAGAYFVQSGDSLEDLIGKVNAGSQSRVAITINGTVAAPTGSSGVAICIGNEAYYVGGTGGELSALGTGKVSHFAGTATGLATAINNSSVSFWAATCGSTVYVFCKDGGDNNSLRACEQVLSAAGTADQAELDKISFRNVASDISNNSGVSFSLGGEYWGSMQAVKNSTGTSEVWNTVLSGRDTGSGRDLQIGQPNAANHLLGANSPLALNGKTLAGAKYLTRASFTEVQNADDSAWVGADIRSQSAAQASLEAISRAIEKKDVIRANLGSVQNRLEATMSNLEVQAENLLAAESRISDVDVALETTEFAKNNILSQAATGMLAQANTMSQLALALIR